ncbi:MAG: hypothetical protein ACHQ1G_03415, partial [Planctomycetota bacterium]
MRSFIGIVLLSVGVGSCGGGGSAGQQGTFRLIQFLEQGQNGIPRNRVLTFQFSSPVADGQDFAERLKIQNTQGGPGSNFSLAIGTYDPVGDRVTFSPRLPNKEDRSDAGFREEGHYSVFLKAGPDALVSTGGDKITNPQEMLFDTSEFFEDPLREQPPRALRLLARDLTNGQANDLSRADPMPGELALLDSNELLQQARAVEPGGGGAPSYGAPWVFELHMSEPLDPATVTPDMVELLEIRGNALTGATTADPGHVGDPVLFKVPILVGMVQQTNASGELEIYIRVEAVQTLVDDARYRLSFSGDILGIDFRRAFTGDNGLTGDGEEPGGLGYTTEFLVYDRPAITASRTITYDPIADGIAPETGQTATNEALFNTALYNPGFSPGTAVGKVSDFGDGSDGNLAVSGGGTQTIDTGDVLNPPSGIDVTTFDVDFADQYVNKGMPTAGPRTTQGREPLELELENEPLSATANQWVKGVNPSRHLRRGVV